VNIRLKYAYAVLVVISMLLSLAVLLVCMELVQDNKSQTCGLLGIIASKNVSKPVHPSAEPSQNSDYLRHRRFVALDRNC
jgi:hypothetical protein